MKKIFIVLLITISIGAVLAYLMFRELNQNIESAFFGYEEITAFQAGVFTNEESAYKVSETLKNATVVKDGDFYRVYISVLNNNESIEIMKNHFNNENIKYYLRKIAIKTGDFLNELNKYEEILLKSNEKSTKDAINKKILEMYERMF